VESQKKISVLISVYSKENAVFLEEALLSIINQTCLPSEIVLVKDGALTPDLDRVISIFQEKYPLFKILENATNLGLGLSLAKGLLACSNEYVGRMDSDDFSKPDRFEKQLKVLDHGYDAVSSWSEFFEGDITNIIATKKRPASHEEIVRMSKRRSPLCHASIMFRKSAVLRAGNYKHLLNYEDYYLWLRMIDSGAKFYNLQDFVYSVRTSGNQFGRRGGWSYLTRELKYLWLFHKEGYHTLGDFIVNSTIRIFVRLTPIKLRRKLYMLIWKTFN